MAEVEKKTENLVYAKPKLITDNVMHYCPGCSHGTVHLKESEIRVGSKHNDMISPAEWWCNDSEIEMVENTHCLKYYNYVWEIAN